MTRQNLWGIVRSTGQGWSSHNAPRLGAALAYYTLLSIAPLVVLLVAICGLALGKSEAEQRLMAQVQTVVSPAAAGLIQSLLSNVQRKGTGIFAGVAAVIIRGPAAINRPPRTIRRRPSRRRWRSRTAPTA